MYTTTRAKRQRTPRTVTDVVAGTFLWAVDACASGGEWTPLRHDVEPASTAERLAAAIAAQYQIDKPHSGRRRVRVWTWMHALPPNDAELAAYAADFPPAAHIETPS